MARRTQQRPTATNLRAWSPPEVGANTSVTVRQGLGMRIDPRRQVDMFRSIGNQAAARRQDRAHAGRKCYHVGDHHPSRPDESKLRGYPDQLFRRHRPSVTWIGRMIASRSPRDNDGASKAIRRGRAPSPYDVIAEPQPGGGPPAGFSRRAESASSALGYRRRRDHRQQAHRLRRNLYHNVAGVAVRARGRDGSRTSRARWSIISSDARSRGSRRAGVAAPRSKVWTRIIRTAVVAQVFWMESGSADGRRSLTRR